MAEELAGYESTEVRRQYRAADLSGQRAAVNELGRAAAALGNLGAASQQQARVIESLGSIATNVGAELAQQRGEQKPLPQMRDQNGDMVPMPQVQTLSIERQAYQTRAVNAWANEAELAYREETNRAWGQYNTEPDRFREHMEGYRTKLLANAPDSIRTQLQQRLDTMGEGRAAGLDASKFARDKKAGDMAITKNLDNDFRDMHSLVLRNTGDIWVPTDNGRAPDPEIIAKQDDMLVRIEGLSTVNPTVVEKLKDKIGSEMFLSRSGAWITNLGNSSADDMEFLERARVYEQALEAGEVTVFGFRNGERAAISIDDLSLDDRQAVLDYTSARKRVVLQNLRQDIAIDHDRFRYGVAYDVIKRIASNSFSFDPQYEQIIATDASTRGLDQNLVRSIIQIESKGNQNAVSKDGAVGLGQIMPGTFKDFKVTADASITDAGDNLRAAANYMDHLKRIVTERFPTESDFNVGRLVAAGYFGGEGRLRKIMARKGFEINNPATWGDYNVGVPGEDSEARYIEKFTETYLGAVGGHQAHVEAFKQKAQQAYGHSPRQYVQVMGAFYNDLRAALNQNEVNRNLTYQPPPFDTGMGKRYVEARWNRSFDAADPRQAYMSVMDSLPPDAPGYQMVKSEAYARQMRALGTGNSSGAKLTRQFLAQPGEPFPREDAIALDAQLKPHPVMTGQANMFEGVKQLTQQALAQTGNDINAASDMVRDHLVHRWTLEGRMLNGRLPMEAIKSFSTGVDELRHAQNDPATIASVVKLLQHFTDTPDFSVATQGAGYDANSALAALDNISRIDGGPTHAKAPESTIRQAIRFINRNGQRLVENDADARKKLNDILNGKIPEDAYKNLDKEAQAVIDEDYAAISEAAFPAVMRAFRNRIPNIKHVDPDIEKLVKDRAAALAPNYSADDLDMATYTSMEQLVREGVIGGSLYTFNAAIMQDPMYRRAQPTLTTYPLEHSFRHIPNALPTPEVYALLDDETRKGTLYGATQVELDKLTGPLRGAMEEHQAGRLAWIVTKGGQYPQILAMHKVKAGGTTGYDWQPLSMIDTTEMVNINREGGGVDNAFNRAVNLAYAEAYGFLDPRDRENLGWIADTLTKGSGYAEDIGYVYDTEEGMLNPQQATGVALRRLFTRELPPIVNYLGGQMPGSPEMVAGAIKGVEGLAP